VRAAYPEWLADSSPTWAFRQIEELLDEGLDDEQFRVAARDILANTRLGQLTRCAIARRLKQLPAIDWDAGVFRKMRVQLVIDDGSGRTKIMTTRHV
jgi:hypothetical protein